MLRRVALVASAVLVVLATGACSDGSAWWAGDGWSGPGVVDAYDRVLTGPVDGRTEAEFSLVTGAASVSVRGVDLIDAPYRISTPDGSAYYPAVIDDGRHVQLHLRKRGDGGPGAVTVELDAGVRWWLRFDAGVTSNVIDMTAGQLAAIDLAAGMSRLELRLPAPSGTVRVHLGAGANELAVSVPAGTPARVRVGDGAASVDIDGERRSGVPAGTTFPAAGYESTVDRYDIDLATGVSTLRLDHR
jgi:hypothetical protein